MFINSNINHFAACRSVSWYFKVFVTFSEEGIHVIVPVSLGFWNLMGNVVTLYTEQFTKIV